MNLASGFDRGELSLKSRVISHIRDAILYGDLAPGRRLPERELCEQLGVSRTLIREAIQHLQAEGLVTAISHRGLTVSQLTDRDAREIFAVREVLEAFIGRLFAANAGVDVFDALETCVDELGNVGASGDYSATLRLKHEIYEILIQGCGSETVGNIHTQLNNRISLLRRRSLANPGRLQQSVLELKSIVAAARARDIQRTGELCAAHVRAAAAAAGYTEE
ncbi:GntR family transcriptional regulator [Salinibacterium sp. M195]|uniref:GntR family transcriptional regulator n=1 Tax=Salinibacterium sp. M195 TaxID=2583374 RepID=UPI001C6335C4|nr:GntR family transcriptional regulator [Salinibacterium sp. M195]QYH35466.1 GntR family transcriptional regulator [Salinibacterium sp. M195]